MPKLNIEYVKKGYKAILPRAIHDTQVKRKPGYLEEVYKRGKLDNGVLYLSPDDHQFIRDNFYKHNPYNTERRSALVRLVKSRVHYNLREKRREDKRLKEIEESTGIQKEIVLFLDVKEACPRPEWEGLREAYLKEYELKTAEDCTDCQLNTIKSKYRKIIIDKYGEDSK